jgi:hypothetical protein
MLEGDKQLYCLLSERPLFQGFHYSRHKNVFASHIASTSSSLPSCICRQVWDALLRSADYLHEFLNISVRKRNFHSGAPLKHRMDGQAPIAEHIRGADCLLTGKNGFALRRGCRKVQALHRIFPYPQTCQHPPRCAKNRHTHFNKRFSKLYRGLSPN